MSMCNEYMTYTNICLSSDKSYSFSSFSPHCIGWNRKGRKQGSKRTILLRASCQMKEKKDVYLSIASMCRRLLRQFLNQPLVMTWPNFAIFHI